MSGQSGTTVTASISTNFGASESDACMSCYEDPACFNNPLVKTAQNYISVCRLGHGIFFLAYALLLLIVVILVWLASNGSISSTVNAWVSTLISAIVIVFMFFQFYFYVRGVIPNCCGNNGCGVASDEMSGNSNFVATTSISSSSDNNK